ncbi:MAG: hypothetical protein Kow0049_15580 [Stanieria sp.]
MLAGGKVGFGWATVSEAREKIRTPTALIKAKYLPKLNENIIKNEIIANSYCYFMVTICFFKSILSIIIFGS